MKIEVKKKMNAVRDRCCTKVTEKSERTTKSSGQCYEQSRKHAFMHHEREPRMLQTRIDFLQREYAGADRSLAQNFILCGRFCIYN
jgi:hypothetical protein